MGGGGTLKPLYFKYYFKRPSDEDGRPERALVPSAVEGQRVEGSCSFPFWNSSLATRHSPLPFYFQTRTNTAPCRGTCAVNSPSNVPKSLWAQRSRTWTLPLNPRSLKLTFTGNAPARLNNPTATLPSASGFAQTSRGPSAETRCPCAPFASWS